MKPILFERKRFLKSAKFTGVLTLRHIKRYVAMIDSRIDSKRTRFVLSNFPDFYYSHKTHKTNEWTFTDQRHYIDPPENKFQTRLMSYGIQVYYKAKVYELDEIITYKGQELSFRFGYCEENDLCAIYRLHHRTFGVWNGCRQKSDLEYIE